VLGPGRHIFEVYFDGFSGGLAELVPSQLVVAGKRHDMLDRRVEFREDGTFGVGIPKLG